MDASLLLSSRRRKKEQKGLFWNFSPEILSPLIGAALKQGSVAKQPVIVIVNVIVKYVAIAKETGIK